MDTVDVSAAHTLGDLAADAFAAAAEAAAQATSEQHSAVQAKDEKVFMGEPSAEEHQPRKRQRTDGTEGELTDRELDGTQNGTLPSTADAIAAAARMAAAQAEAASQELRRIAMASKESLEQLVQDAALSGPAAEKARSTLVSQWLLENYEACEGISLPRSSLYEHYGTYCLEHRIEPVNSASFGKLIRSVFPDLKTRRLGTRGKSKYHYCGIRLRNGDQQLPVHRAAEAASAAVSAREDAVPQSQGGLVLGEEVFRLHQQAIDKSMLAKMPEIPEIPDAQVPAGLDISGTRAFLEAYKDHCQTILQSVQYMKFSEVESIVKEYWQNLPEDDRDIANNPEIVEYVWRYDSLLYDTIMNLLLPNVLQMMPIQIIQAVRQFARQLETWMVKALEGFGQLLTTRKLEVAKVFIQQLRRHTSLNHLAQAAAAVLDNQETVSQMLVDWNRIDFENIRDQASWVCECRKTDIMQIMEIDFRQLLQHGSKLDTWTNWLETVVNRFLDVSLDPQRYVYVARQFLLKWAFYSSLAMRDLTLRSAVSFGSFHLLRLLFDEYIFYLVEQRIANIKAFEQQEQQAQAAQQAAQQVQQAVEAVSQAEAPSQPVDQW
ncbi:DNA-binding protein rfx2 [Borealophlyctis nickersoniae]|nr:DNA-binding protein rfx2 [Borealophlyctis nickersoniae]